MLSKFCFLSFVGVIFFFLVHGSTAARTLLNEDNNVISLASTSLKFCSLM